MRFVTTLGAACVLLTGAAATAGVIDFTENFDTGPADWYDAGGTSVVGWSAGGGPGGAADAYATTSFAFANAGPFGATLFRGQDEFDSSGGAFVGDWVASEVVLYRFQFRHNAPVPVSLFTRFANPANFPAALGVSFVPALPNTWTEIVIPISADSPNLVSFEGADFDTIFSNIGNLQVGVDVPKGFEMDTTEYTFDLDAVTVLTIPAPGALGVLAGAALAGRRRRRA